MSKIRAFVRAVSRHWLGKLGVVVTNASFFTLLILEFLRITGVVTNSYIGLVTYMTLPAFFLLGLAMIPISWHRLKKINNLTHRQLMEREFDPEFLKARKRGSNLVTTVTLLTLINVIFFVTVAARMLHFMDQPVFCGTACHVMLPEWSTYQASPHAHVACVNCHVGEGVAALIDAKINGLYQVASVALNLYERPIPTPVHQLRPARETCEKCHWPDKFYGNRLKTIAHFEQDSANTVSYTTLALKVGAAESKPGSGIHWHISKGHEVVYQSAGMDRETMIWVEVRNHDGSVRRFENEALDAEDIPEETETRSMDCVDCHNRATHIYEPMEDAIDSRLAKGTIPENLPFIKKAAVAALSNNYPDKATGLVSTFNFVHDWYRSEHPQISSTSSAEIDLAAAAIRDIYARNIHPDMNISWDAYPSHIGHRNDEGGCFRCHNDEMVDEDGEPVNFDCTICHSILAWDEPEPFAFMSTPDNTPASYAMHLFPGDEFINSDIIR